MLSWSKSGSPTRAVGVHVSWRGRKVHLMHSLLDCAVAIAPSAASDTIAATATDITLEAPNASRSDTRGSIHSPLGAPHKY